MQSDNKVMGREVYSNGKLPVLTSKSRKKIKSQQVDFNPIEKKNSMSMDVSKMISSNQGHVSKKKSTRYQSVQLSAMDQRILVLYNSKLKRTLNLLEIKNPSTGNSPERLHAAIHIQRIYRGCRTRKELESFNGPRNQTLALKIQCVFRGFIGKKKAKFIRAYIAHRAALKIQSIMRSFIAK